MKLVSACLTGNHCRYNGEAAIDTATLRLFQKGEVFPVCPEELGGLSTPRPPAWLTGGTGDDVLDGKARVVRANGEDVTSEFIAGAEAVLRVAQDVGVSEAVFKARSPSCGKGRVYCDGKLRKGNGVCTALLLRAGCTVRVRGN
jgi:uncharacterized protein YbbK (DUF523 family)